MEFLATGPHRAASILLLAHGAGAPMDSQFMDDFAEGLAARGVAVLRFEFPYMADRRVTGKKRPPDRAPVLLDCWRRVIAQVSAQGIAQGITQGITGVGRDRKLVIGGKSMGGRMASMIADEAGVAGLVCLGYPFHPPGKPEKTRMAHLGDLKTPALIVQGTRDPFGDRAEVVGYELSPAIRLHWIEDGDHDFSPRKSSGRTSSETWSEAMDMIVDFMKKI